MSPARTAAVLAALLMLASSGAVLSAQRARLGVGLVILPDCRPAPSPDPDTDAPPPPAPQAAPLSHPPELETLARCSGGVARVVARAADAVDPRPPPGDPGAKATTQVLLIEF